MYFILKLTQQISCEHIYSSRGACIYFYQTLSNFNLISFEEHRVMLLFFPMRSIKFELSISINTELFNLTLLYDQYVVSKSSL